MRVELGSTLAALVDLQRLLLGCGTVLGCGVLDVERVGGDGATGLDLPLVLLLRHGVGVRGEKKRKQKEAKRKATLRTKESEDE